GSQTACKANRDLDQPTAENAKHPSLNSTLGCLKIVDTFRVVKGRGDRQGASGAPELGSDAGFSGLCADRGGEDPVRPADPWWGQAVPQRLPAKPRAAHRD